MLDNSIKNIKSQDALLINFQQLLIGTEMDINFIPDALVNIPLTSNQVDSDEQFQNINLEMYAQKIEKINKQISELQKAVNYLYNENKAVKEINFNLTQQLFTKIYNQDHQLEQRTLYLNYEFTKQANIKLRDENEKLQDKILIMQIEHDQQKAKIQKLEQKKTQDKQQLKDMLFFDNNVLDDSQLGESIKENIKEKEKEVSQPQTANTSKVSQKSNKIQPKPTARKTMVDLNQSKLEELKKTIQPTQTAKKTVKKTESQSTFIKSEIKKK